jgi:hypothetical protein
VDCGLCEAAAEQARAEDLSLNGAPRDRWPRGVWLQPSIVAWSQLLLDSLDRWTGHELISRQGTAEEQSGTLFFAPLVVVSHGTEPDPLFNYGNQTALELWETDWSRLIGMPSRLTAETEDQAERQRMLDRVAKDGYVRDYRGVRRSVTGRRFSVEDALVWTVLRLDGTRKGEAAAFSRWSHLPERD